MLVRFPFFGNSCDHLKDLGELRPTHNAHAKKHEEMELSVEHDALKSFTGRLSQDKPIIAGT